jgi:hypothetical protein
VTDLYDPKTKYFANCNKWFDKDKGDGQISRDLVLHKNQAGDRQSEKQKNCNEILDSLIFIDNKYKVTVYTGKKMGAGTDADVFITLYGNKDESGAILLDDKKNNFEAGKCVLKYFLQFLIFSFISS